MSRDTAGTTPTPAESAPHVYSADRPLLDVGEDRLGRRSFANRIADSLVARTDPSSLVVGVYGEWGDGKSTVLNFIERRLQKTAASSVICVRFNPWLYGDEPTVINEFFRLLGKSIDAKLDTTSEKVGKYLRQAGSTLSGVSVGTSTVAAGGTVLQSVGGFLPEATLTELRDRVEKALQAAAKRVVVFIDDVDRLDRHEITTVMRLVKIAADFSLTAYVLAFDPAVVAAALAERYPNSAPFGEDFLDKIVQVPLTLPRTDAAVVRQILLEDVGRLFETHEIQLTPDEETRLWMAMDDAVLPRLRTVRIARRLSNALEFALPIVPGEVNAVDVVLIEALRTLYPQAYIFVKASVDWIVSPLLGRLSRDDADRFKPATEGLSANDADNCQKLLRQLFPQLDNVFGNVTYSTDQANTWTEQRRICSPRYCQRFFAYGIPVGDVADAEIAQLMRGTKNGQASTLLESLFERAGDGLVLQKLSDRLPEVEPDEVAPLASVLCEHAPSLTGIDRPSFGSPMVQASSIVVRLTRELPDDERTATLRALVEASDERFALLLFGMLRSYSGQGSEGGFDATDVAQLAREFAERLLNLDSTESLARRWPYFAAEMYAHCVRYGSKDKVIDRVIAHAETSLDEAATFIRIFLPGIEQFAGRYSMSGPTPLRYQEFAKVITAGRLVDAVRANLPELDERVSAFLANPSAGPRVDDLDAPRRDAASSGVRFAALHTLMTASESVTLEPSVTTVGPASLSSGRGSPSSSYVFDERHDATLTIRVLTDLPAEVGDFKMSTRPASALPQTARDGFVIDLLEGSEVTALLNAHFDHRGHESTVGWELRGDNIDDRSRAHSVPASEGVPMWSIAYIETGWLPVDAEPAAGEPTQGVRLVLDLKLDLHDVEHVSEDDQIVMTVGTSLQLRELADIIVTALGSANLAMDVFESMLTGAGDIGSASVTCWMQAKDTGLDSVFDVSDFRAIPGNAARSEEVFGWKLDMPKKSDTAVLARWSEKSRQEAARDLLSVMLQRMGRRDFETALEHLWS